MANAPTRPAGRPRSERRKPKGRPVDRTRRNEMEIASALLHKLADGAEITDGDSLKAVIAAAAVDAVMEPGGWTQIREDEGAFTTNLPLTMRESLRAALKAAAKVRRKSLTGVVTEGFHKVLEGAWTPPEPRRAVRRGQSAADDPRKVLNVTVEDALRVRLRERIPSLSSDLGYTVTEGGIAIAYLKTFFAAELADLLSESKPTGR